MFKPIIALLMVGDRLVRIIDISRPEPAIRYYIRAALYATTDMTSIYYDDTSNTTTYIPYCSSQEIVFRLARQIDPYTFEYQYEAIMNNPKYSFSMYENFTELPEPPEGINLKKLTDRFRDNLEMKKLLVAYYNS